MVVCKNPSVWHLNEQIDKLVVELTSEVKYAHLRIFVVAVEQSDYFYHLTPRLSRPDMSIVVRRFGRLEFAVYLFVVLNDLVYQCLICIDIVRSNKDSKALDTM